MSGETISFDQVKGSLAAMLFLWSDLEGNLRDELVRLSDGAPVKVPRGASQLIYAWQVKVTEKADPAPFRDLLIRSLCLQLLQAAGIRNGLCHGLTGYSAERKGEVAKFTWELDDGPKSMTYDEMAQMLSWLSQIPRAIELLTSDPYEKIGSRLTDTPENRSFWVEEFGLHLDAYDGNRIAPEVPPDCRQSAPPHAP